VNQKSPDLGIPNRFKLTSSRFRAPKASVGIDPINRRPSLGGHPGWAIPHGTMPV
jgi:hypothetical protein